HTARVVSTSRFVASTSQSISKIQIRGKVRIIAFVRLMLGVRCLLGRSTSWRLTMSSRRTARSWRGSFVAAREIAEGPADGIANAEVATATGARPYAGATAPAALDRAMVG